jgi:hypothetical protein
MTKVLHKLAELLDAGLCLVGWHRWWHFQVQRGDDLVDLCCGCGKTRPHLGE